MSSIAEASCLVRQLALPAPAGDTTKAAISRAHRVLKTWTWNRVRDVWHADPRIRVSADELDQLRNLAPDRKYSGRGKGAAGDDALGFIERIAAIESELRELRALISLPFNFVSVTAIASIPRERIVNAANTIVRDRLDELLDPEQKHGNVLIIWDETGAIEFIHQDVEKLAAFGCRHGGVLYGETLVQRAAIRFYRQHQIKRYAIKAPAAWLALVRSYHHEEARVALAEWLNLDLRLCHIEFEDEAVLAKYPGGYYRPVPLSTIAPIFPTATLSRHVGGTWGDAASS